MDTPKINWGKIWLLIFCVGSLISCIFFAPYDIWVLGKHQYEKVYGSVLWEPRNDYLTKSVRRAELDYEMLAIREVVMAVVCVGGYALSTMKKN